MTENKKSKVNVHSKLTVVSSKPVVPGKTHPLTAMDHAMGNHTLHVVFYYERNPFREFDLDPLRVSLSEVLSVYPPVTGRLSQDQSGNWEVKCNDAGLRVLRARVVGVSVDEWLRFGDASEERDLTVWEPMPDGDPTTWAPFRFQITDFEGGGIAIGLSCTHMHADPTTVTLLFKSWTELYRRQPIGHPPSHDPPTVSGQKDSKTADPESANYYSGKANAQAQRSSVRMSTATFRFSSSVIKHYLSEIHGDCPDATPFDLLTALFWMRVVSLRAPKHDCQHSLSVCLDFRRLLQEPLPYGYFGNALHFSQLSLNEEELAFSRLGYVAGLVHRHVSGIKEKDIWSALDWFESQKGEDGKYAPPFRMYGTELTCVSVEHMIVGDQSFMYAAVFEEDTKPAHVAYHVGNVEGEGMIMVTPSSGGGLARTVMVTLPEDDIARLCEDQAIMRLEPTKLFRGGQ